VADHPADSYWRDPAHCDKHGILLVADEVICGCGRTGNWFGSELYGIRPDLMTWPRASRRATCRSGRMVAPRVAEVLIEQGARVATATVSGPPFACAVASVNLSIIEQENSWRDRDETGPYLALQVAEIAEHPCG